jgi:hypothetical protein
VDKYLQKKFEAGNNFDQVINEALDELKIERDSTHVIYPSTLLNISKTLIARGLYEEGIKALKFLIDNKPMLLLREEDRLKNEVRRFLFDLEGHIKAKLSIFYLQTHLILGEHIFLTYSCRFLHWPGTMLKGVSSKPSGDCIVAQNVCFLS